MSQLCRPVAIALAAICVASSSACGSSGDGSLEPDLRQTVIDSANAPGSESTTTLVKLANALARDSEMRIDADLRDDVAKLLVANTRGLRDAISDPESPDALETRPERLLVVVEQVATDENSAVSVSRAVNAAGLLEADAAVADFVRTPADQRDSAEGRLEARLEDSARASGAIAAVLGLEEAENMPLGDVLDFLDSEDEALLPEGMKYYDFISAVQMAAYRHAPASALPDTLAEHPPTDSSPEVKAAYSKWVRSDSTAITLDHLGALQETVENPWIMGIDEA